MLSFIKGNISKTIRRYFYYLVVLNLLYIIFLILVSPLRYYSPLMPYDLRIEQSKYNDLQIATYINNFPERITGKILVSRQGSFSYYAKQKYLSVEDPKMIEFYDSKTTDQAKNILMSLGITHFISADYPTPPTYNSFLPKLLSDLNFATLEHRVGGYSFYSFNYKDPDKNFTKYRLSDEWTISNELIGGQSFLLNNDSNQGEILSYDNSNNTKPIWITEGVSRLSYSYEVPTRKKEQNINMHSYALDGEVIINGVVEIYAIIFDQNGIILRKEDVWKGVAKNRKVSIGGQFLVAPNNSYKLAFKVNRRSNIKLVNLDISSSELNKKISTEVLTGNFAYITEEFYTLKGANSSFSIMKSINGSSYPKIEIKNISGYGGLVATINSNCDNEFIQPDYSRISFLPKFIINIINDAKKRLSREYLSYFINSSEPQDLTLDFKKNLKIKDSNVCIFDIKLHGTSERKNSNIKFTDILINGEKL